MEKITYKDYYRAMQVKSAIYGRLQSAWQEASALFEEKEQPSYYANVDDFELSRGSVIVHGNPGYKLASVLSSLAIPGEIVLEEYDHALLVKFILEAFKKAYDGEEKARQDEKLRQFNKLKQELGALLDSQ